MLRIRLKVINLEDSHRAGKIVKRLNRIGYVEKTTIDMDNKTLSFEYASYRDMDGALMELRKMGVKYTKTMDSKRTVDEKTNTSG
ncbi:hypothetical protein L0P88_10720 [Muricauda sp. SCSIO 64092]|uniref:hypothetical protein n=1 Tax=Allomuricauda sp. SCSIO 64092 TaxID=2908842 RepID=UPI001FF48719|nr:hypothetical protein [Muricauda sp. SCSIO 64092]UOY08984.1 hypothetical protein L0P88_10720 [Muricauda sp. SCSIO 64092]